MGRPCVFVRFAGCNLSCPWCDTDVAKRFSLSLDDLVAEIGQYKPKSVVLTGGEPTLVKEMPELVAALKELGYWIAVETNGTDDADWLGFVDYVACSPKAEFPDRLALTRASRRPRKSSASAAASAAELPRQTTTFRRASAAGRWILRRQRPSSRSSTAGRFQSSFTSSLALDESIFMFLPQRTQRTQSTPFAYFAPFAAKSANKRINSGFAVWKISDFISS